MRKTRNRADPQRGRPHPVARIVVRPRRTQTKETSVKAFLVAMLLITFFCGGVMPRTPFARSLQTALDSADSLFKEGKFEKAGDLYSQALALDQNNFNAVFGLGRVALLANKLDEAQTRLKKALELKPDSQPAKQLLAQAYYRQDRFQEAAPLFRAIGAESVAKKLESFKGITPYEIEGKDNVSAIKFVITDPLPLVRVRAGNSQEVNFLIDTGASEIYLDSDFAREIGVTPIGQTSGTYGGGLHSDTGQGRLDRLILGGFTIKNLPVLILNTRRFAAAAAGNKVDGVIGVELLMHFLSTLDYTGGQLIVARKTRQASAAFAADIGSGKSLAIPFWMAGDHFMLAWGRINSSASLLLLVDTGLAGAGFTGPESTIKDAAIDVSKGHEVQGVGGGG